MRSRSGRKVLLQECRGAQYTICCREVKEERSGLSKSQQKGGLLWWLSRKESAINLCFRKIPWRRKWQPTPVFLPRKTHGQGSLVGYSPWDCKESDTTQRLNTNQAKGSMNVLDSQRQQSQMSVAMTQSEDRAGGRGQFKEAGCEEDMVGGR